MATCFMLISLTPLHPVYSLGVRQL